MKRTLLLIANMIGFVLILFVAVTGKISYSVFISNLSGSIPESAAAIGVIGGADGPTAIFVSGGFDFRVIVFLSGLSLTLVGILLVVNVVYLKNCKNQNT